MNSNSVDARTIAIAHKAKALIVVTDYGEGGECNVNVQTDKLGIRKDASAKDFETGEAVEGSAASSFKLVLQKHDYRILVIE